MTGLIVAMVVACVAILAGTIITLKMPSVPQGGPEAVQETWTCACGEVNSLHQPACVLCALEKAHI